MRFIRDLFNPILKLCLIEYYNQYFNIYKKDIFESNDDFNEIRITFLISPFNNNEENEWSLDKESFCKYHHIPSSINFNIDNDISFNHSYHYNTMLFCETLPSYKLNNVIVNVVNDHRNNPNIKSSNWLILRKQYEDKLKELGYEESLLVDDNGFIYEGLSSNFFLINQNDEIETSPDNLVLGGTLRKIVIDICEENNIKIIYQNPSIKSLESCKAAFITSTSRLILPISEVRDEINGKTYKLNSYDHLKNLSQIVLKKLDSYSVDIFESK